MISLSTFIEETIQFLINIKQTLSSSLKSLLMMLGDTSTLYLIE